MSEIPVLRPSGRVLSMVAVRDAAFSLFEI
jgi:hypothetical protein